MINSAYPIEVRYLAKSYSNGDVPVFSGVSFNVEDGQSVALIGSNGSGKSTLLRCCLRLIEPDSGHIVMHGGDLTEARRRALREARSRVGFVFQKHNLVGSLSVLTNVLHGVQNRKYGPHTWFQGMAKNDDREFAMHCLSRVGLAHLAKRKARDLSGGQSQRVAIARTLMQKPKLMFADEPVASLDPIAGEEVMDLFTQLIRDENLTLLFVSHNLEHALKYSQRIIGLRDHKLALDEMSNTQSVASLRELFG